MHSRLCSRGPSGSLLLPKGCKSPGLGMTAGLRCNELDADLPGGRTVFSRLTAAYMSQCSLSGSIGLYDRDADCVERPIAPCPVGNVTVQRG